MQKISITSCVVITLCYGLFSGLRAEGYSIQQNISESVPLGLYVTTPLKTITSGLLVALRAPERATMLYRDRPWFPHDGLLLKHVVAVGGDHVCVRNGSVFVNGKITAHVTLVDSNKQSMSIDTTCGTLAANQVYLLNAKHDNSFDSRYYGPVSTNQLYAKASAL